MRLAWETSVEDTLTAGGSSFMGFALTAERESTDGGVSEEAGGGVV
jgi:hypothetical protein